MNKQAETRERFWSRLTGLILVAGLLIWVPIEDLSELWVLVFAGVICTWMAGRLLITAPPDNKRLILRHVIVGVGAGLVLAPLVVFLMAFKSGLHGHSVPDFTVDQMITVLSRAPYFTLVGIFLSVGIGIWRLSRRVNSEVEA